ncbi:precorrin-3B C(17)-methyltransferase [Treponema saccharophilum]|uniref:Precorrin-3 methyltransferase n=1 Tax=Treponema saccharophilum DSM 2985 TaxID=907348 RepID=H7EPK0_9SPIR|nr:precorrin-3B C(17)-methyltransferase [Treponema saccharophilum]EIC00401.1 precorrin-3 methyltransferase [Treponema saccharophilum DSM 2985]BDC94937.1 hypothetical protein TRSA_00360 [Treponema saccharophilum]
MKCGKLVIAGIGPGSFGGMTLDAKAAVERAEIIVGYTKYIELVRTAFPEIDGEKFLSTGMMREEERCTIALEEASRGKEVVLVCSGDSCIYGMASLALALSEPFPLVEIEIVPGVTAAVSGGAILGSPLTADFAVISLSNLLIPQEKIEKRLRASSKGDFVIALYNPRSKNRPDVLARAAEILLEERDGKTVCGFVRNIARDGEEFGFCTLSELGKLDMDMFCTVFVGNSETELIERNGRKFMVNPRGYGRKGNG